MKFILLLLGGVIGVLVMRKVGLDSNEVLELDNFWRAVRNGMKVDAGEVLTSETMGKSALGFFAGSLCGLGAAAVLIGKPKPPDPDEGEPKA